MKQILSILIFGLVIWNAAAQTSGKASQKAITNLSPADFAKNLKQSKNHTLLDVRSKEEFAEGHLRTALNINVFDDDFKARVGKLDKTKPIYVYCYSGGRSEEASDLLVELGFAHIFHMPGGYRDWTKAGMEVVK